MRVGWRKENSRKSFRKELMRFWENPFFGPKSVWALITSKRWKALKSMGRETLRGKSALRKETLVLQKK